MACNKNHRYLEEFRDLPNAQDDVNNDRHKCAGCAYVQGILDALNGRPKAATLSESIPDSQAGQVRHKDAYKAYELGYAHGIRINT